jgi:hypothetical protein
MMVCAISNATWTVTPLGRMEVFVERIYTIYSIHLLKGHALTCYPMILLRDKYECLKLELGSKIRTRI